MHANTTNTAVRILNSAHALMVERGYNAFSYADISDAVHVSKASIHHHFPTKSQLAREVIVQYRQGVRAAMVDMKKNIPDPFKRLFAYVGYWESCIRNNTTPFCICALLAAEIPSLPDEVNSEIRAHFEQLADWLASTLEEGVESGALHLEKSSSVEAEAFMALVHGAMLSARAYGGVDVFTSVVKFALDRLKPRNSSGTKERS